MVWTQIGQIATFPQHLVLIRPMVFATTHFTDACAMALALLKQSSRVENHLIIGSISNPLAGKFSEDTRKKAKGVKTGASHDWRSFYLSQYDWLKGSHMTKVVGFRMKPIIHTANLWRQILPIGPAFFYFSFYVPSDPIKIDPT